MQPQWLNYTAAARIIYDDLVASNASTALVSLHYRLNATISFNASVNGITTTVVAWVGAPPPSRARRTQGGTLRTISVHSIHYTATVHVRTKYSNM